MCDSGGTPLPAPGNIQAAGTPCNKIPSTMLNPTMVNFAKTFFPAPVSLPGYPQFNGRDTTPNLTHQNQVSLRFDQQVGTKDRFFVRWTAAWQPITASGGFPGLVSNVKNSNYNMAANWTHTFGASAALQLTLGRVSAENDRTPNFTNIPSDYFSQLGFRWLFLQPCALRRASGAVSSDSQLHRGNELRWQVALFQHLGISRGLFEDSWTAYLRTGASLATDGWEQPFYGSEDDFAQSQTQDGNLDSNTGDPLASMVIGVPDYAEVDNVYSLLHGGKIIGAYFQDQWRVTDRLTINWGVRYDLTVNPRQGKASNGSDITGDFNFSNGTYILQNPAPACSATQGAPCIPGGTLPPNVTIAKNGKIIHDNYDNFQPRIGFAFSLTPKTVIHGGIWKVLSTIGQVSQRTSLTTRRLGPTLRSWGHQAGSIFMDLPQALRKTRSISEADPLQPAPSPFSPLNTNSYTDPNLKNGYSDQWNFGFQRELATGVVTTMNYVGSRNARIATSITANALTSPGGSASLFIHPADAVH